MVPVPRARPQTFRPVFAQPRSFVSVAISLAEFDGGYRYVAVDGRRSWRGDVAAPNLETAVLDAVEQLRAGLSPCDRIQFVVDVPPDSPLWRYTGHLAAILPDVGLERPTASSRRLVEAARETVRQIGAEPDAPASSALEAVIVAADGSVRGKHAGFGWLTSTGEYGLGRFRCGVKLTGPMPVLVAELRAIGAACQAFAGRQVKVSSDSRQAVAMATRWMRGEWVMPAGYYGDADGRCRLAVMAQHICAERDRIDVRWVRGHCGEPLNEGADALARLGSRHERGDRDLDADEYHRRAKGIAEAFAAEYRRTAGTD